MLSDLRPDDDFWRAEAFRRMDHASAKLHRIESDDPYPVEEGSDLAGDRKRVPDVFVDTVATRRLKVAVDYLAGVRDLLGSGTHYYAPFPLLRGVIEAATAAIWLLQPNDTESRCRRLVGLHIFDTNEKKSTQAMLPPEHRDGFDHQPGINRMLHAAGGSHRFASYAAVIEAVDDFPGDGASMLLTWRICSGFSHGLTWATSNLLPEYRREQVGPTLHRVESSPNYQLVAIQTRTAVRAVELADTMFEIRRLSRPHNVTLNATPYV